MCYPETGEAGIYREGLLCPGPDWSVLVQMRTLNPHSLVGRKSTVLIAWNAPTLIGQ